MPRFAAIPQANRRTRMYPLASGQTFLKGAAVLLDASEEVIEASADPTAVLGFAAEPAAGRDILTDEMLVNVAGPTRSFLMTGDNDPTENDVNQQYGVAKDADGVWYVDGTDTTNVVVEVVAVDLDRNLYEVVVLESDLQIPDA